LSKPEKEVAKRRNPWIGPVLVAILIVAMLGVVWTITSLLPILMGYKAEDTRSYSGIVAHDMVYAEVENFNGPIQIASWDNAEYQIDLKIEASGSSQENAEDNLDALIVNFDESVVKDQKRLILNYDVPVQVKSNISVEVNVILPFNTTIDLNLISSNGDIHLTNLEVGTLDVVTSNGRLVFENVYADSLIGETSNGRIEGDLEADEAVLSTSNGDIEFTIPCTISGEYDLSTSNGAIELAVSSSVQVGYDLDLATSNGNITINLSDLDYNQNENTKKVAKTDGFDDKATQITIEASTSNGDIDIHTS